MALQKEQKALALGLLGGAALWYTGSQLLSLLSAAPAEKSESVAPAEAPLPELKLTYFNFMGRAEKIRLALHLQGIPFEDFRPGRNEWRSTIKPSTKYGQLPYMAITSAGTTKELYQSDAILRYVARLRSSTLYPTGPDQTLVDEVMEVANDWYKSWNPCLYINMYPQRYGYAEGYNKTEEGKQTVKKLRTTFVAESLPKFMKYFSDFLEASDSKFLAGPNLTIADLTIFPILVHFKSGNIDHVPKSVLEPFPAVTAWIARVQAVPAIKQWYKDHPNGRVVVAEAAKPAPATAVVKAAGGVPLGGGSQGHHHKSESMTAALNERLKKVEAKDK